ncbi:MAG: hypothetical protein ACLP5V_00815 [Candidatus Bathyarchaeia archaeon]
MNSKSGKNVVLVGAGFSCDIAGNCGLHMPSGRTLLRESFEYAEKNGVPDRYKLARGFLKDLWSVKSDADMDHVDLEECLQMVANPNEMIANRFPSDATRSQLTELVVLYVSHCSHEISKFLVPASDHKGHHTATSLWAYNLARVLGERPDTFISINWDLLVDYSIWEYG